jgi:hypothetical protein
MRNKSFILSAIFTIVVSFSLNANDIWRTHLAYNDVQSITQTPNKVFALSSGALFSFDKRDNSIEVYSKVNGLSDNSISYIKYDERNDIVVVIYENSNIDLITTGGIFNIPDLLRATITGSKKVNHIYFNGDFAYLSADFGIVIISMTKKEIADTYIIGENGANVSVTSTVIWNDSIYAAVDNNIYAANRNKNLSDFQNWKSRNLFASDENIEIMELFQNNLFLLTKSESKQNIYKKENQLNDELSLFLENVVFMEVSQEILNLTTENSILYYSSTALSPELKFTVNQSLFDKNNNLFFAAAGGSGLLRISANGEKIESFKPIGPVFNDPFTMKFSGGKLFVITPGPHILDGAWDTGNLPGAVMIYEGKTWLNLTEGDIPAAAQPFRGTMNIAINPADSKNFFVGTWHRGLYEFRNNAFYKLYDYTNSLIQYNPSNVIIIDGLTFDKDNNLWMTQTGTADAVKVLKKNGEWKSFYFSDFTNRVTLQKIVIDNNNFKWINTPRQDVGIFVFDDRGTIDDIAGDRHRFIKNFTDQDGNNFSYNGSIRHCALDKREEQKMWVATGNGPIIIPDTKKAFDSDFSIQRIKIPRNDGTELADYLLENEQINWIEVDGGNRKWLATASSGVLLVSEDGTSTLKHYTTENSPLLSNNVWSIAINSETGEVFFGTDKGIVSVIGDATEGENGFENIYAYPNPVREDYVGTIHIVGLEDRSDVKITDVAGNIVYQTTSNGGMATWDGNNIYGHRVATGVYLVQTSSADKSKKGICKILIINNR